MKHMDFMYLQAEGVWKILFPIKLAVNNSIIMQKIPNSMEKQKALSVLFFSLSRVCRIFDTEGMSICATEPARVEPSIMTGNTIPVIIP